MRKLFLASFHLDAADGSGQFTENRILAVKCEVSDTLEQETKRAYELCEKFVGHKPFGEAVMRYWIVQPTISETSLGDVIDVRLSASESAIGE